MLINLKSWSQPNALLVKVVGRIESADSSAILPFVHIISMQSRLGTISDSLGIFMINIKPNDTLIFRSIGFNDQIYAFHDSMGSASFYLKIKMSPISYELQVVDVYALTPKMQFKYDLVHMPLDESYLKKQLVIPGVNKLDYRTVQTNEKPIYPTYIGGPLAFAYKLSQKSRSLEKLAGIVADDIIREENKFKYSFDYLGEISGFSDEKLLSFYAFLNFSTDYISKTNGYDIMIEILRQLPLFESYYFEHGAILHLNDSISN